MARPLKDKNLLLNKPLKIMLTAEQKRMIEGAAKADGLDVTSWARPILLAAAKPKNLKAGTARTRRS